MKLQIKNFKIPKLEIRQKRRSLQAYFSVIIADKDSLIEIHRIELHNFPLANKPEPWLTFPQMSWWDESKKEQMTIPFVELDIDLKNKILKEVYQQWELASKNADKLIEQAKAEVKKKQDENFKKNLENIDPAFADIFDLDKVQAETEEKEVPLHDLQGFGG